MGTGRKGPGAVSYTHLDVYKRQRYAERECPVSGCFCDNAENLAGYYRDGATAGCPGCCANCNNAATCDNACTEIRTAIENTSGWESEYKGGEEGPELELQPQELPLEPHPRCV